MIRFALIVFLLFDSGLIRGSAGAWLLKSSGENIRKGRVCRLQVLMLKIVHEFSLEESWIIKLLFFLLMFHPSCVFSVCLGSGSRCVAPCFFNVLGCTFVCSDLSILGQHQSECPYRRVHCPDGTCHYVGPANQVTPWIRGLKQAGRKLPA
jgi:hypothetical protein